MPRIHPSHPERDIALVHFAFSPLDKADEILQAAWDAQEHGRPDNEGPNAEWADKDEEIDSDTGDKVLALNVESIPLFDGPHSLAVFINEPLSQHTRVNMKDPVVAFAEREDWTALDWLQVEYSEGSDFA
ncbi:hypothetical protein BDW69DRAFT_190212 [Aspergillus filifer]